MIYLMRKLPFSYFWCVSRLIPKYVKTVLDLGTGKGELASYIKKQRGVVIDGIEIYKPYIEFIKNKNIYRNLIIGDITKEKLNVRKYDLILASQVLEHLSKDKAYKIIKYCEKYVAKYVIIGVPNGRIEQLSYDGNKNQEHKSFWVVKDLTKLGYKVYGQGAGWLYKKDQGMILALKYLFYLFGYITSPYYFYHPESSVQLIAIKKVYE